MNFPTQGKSAGLPAIGKTSPSEEILDFIP
jgi:hypothetical protein